MIFVFMEPTTTTEKTGQKKKEKKRRNHTFMICHSHEGLFRLVGSAVVSLLRAYIDVHIV